MKRYTVKVSAKSEGSFNAVYRFDPEAVIELEKAGQRVEVYSICTEYDIDHLLNASDGVKTWTVK